MRERRDGTDRRDGSERRESCEHCGDHENRTRESAAHGEALIVLKQKYNMLCQEVKSMLPKTTFFWVIGGLAAGWIVLTGWQLNTLTSIDKKVAVIESELKHESRYHLP